MITAVSKLVLLAVVSVPVVSVLSAVVSLVVLTVPGPVVSVEVSLVLYQ